jgi:hypothetical protein
MTLIAVCSLKGSPGVTTFSVALAARWPVPDRCVLVECDPSGGDVATRFALASSPGLVKLAAATRRSTDPELLWQHTQDLPGGLSVVTAPPGADQALAALAPDHSGEDSVLRRAANAPQVVVIADCGRIDPSSAALPIVCSADVMLLLSRAHADDLAHLAARLTAVASWSPRPGLLLVGQGHSTAEVHRELGVPVMGRIPEDRQARRCCAVGGVVVAARHVPRWVTPPASLSGLCSRVRRRRVRRARAPRQAGWCRYRAPSPAGTAHR